MTNQANTKTILVVDDEPAMRSLFEDILNSIGMTAMVASDGEAALNLLKNHSDKISAVVLDVVMPRLDGIATYRNIRKLESKLPIIFSSGYLENPEMIALRQNESVPLIQKPFKKNDFIALLNQVLADSAV